MSSQAQVTTIRFQSPSYQEKKQEKNVKGHGKLKHKALKGSNPINRHNQHSEKRKPNLWNRRKYLPILYLLRHCYPEYMKNSYNSVTTTKSNLIKNGQNLEQRRYVKAHVERAQMNIKFINKYAVLYLYYSNSRGKSRSQKPRQGANNENC